ncbi:MAG TPA: NAD(P)H-binding protein [Streptomyces sp.]|uniref:NAD(P)H-binding protein n=1 Tax=Streptomyces sp. TaxID=1931 RepID=UPI002B63122D|nr:NAD(P)H-binding protein [Streptomyces sp.]HWU10353.1 NAD(P)H-binding protein [Streptomyces sp.]
MPRGPPAGTARGVQIWIADYDQPGTLATASHSGDKVLLISGSELGRRVPQHRTVVDAAPAAGVALLACTGILGGPEADFTLGQDHQATEEIIRNSGLPHVLLRNGFYSDDYLNGLADTLKRGRIDGNAGTGKAASATRADFAAAAATVLTEDGHQGRIHELSGDTAWTFTGLAAEISRRADTEVTYHNLAPAERRTALLQAGLPEAIAGLLIDIDDALARGLLAGTPGDLNRLIGRPTTPITETIANALKTL